MRVLVTGGTGFIGSRLVAALLERGNSVRVLRREGSSSLALKGLAVEQATGDILDADSVARAVAGCDVVYHVAALATYWRARREEVYRVNVHGTRVVMEECLAARVPRVVFTSSVAAIGLPADDRPADENHPFDARSLRMAYADSKHRAEGEVEAAVKRGLDAVIVNPAVVLGAGDHYMVSGSTVVEMARGRVPANPPGGVCVADVDAVVAGHLAAAERGRTGHRYILGGENLRMRSLAAIIAEVVGRPPPAVNLQGWMLGPAGTVVDAFNRIYPGSPIVSGEQIRLMNLFLYFDSGKAVRELNYPLLPARGAVEKAYQWYCDNGYI